MVVMMQGEKLRRADFVTSILLLSFGVWMLGETFTMPMRDTFGGVQNVWYVSPALFPLIISAGLLLLGTVLLLHAIRSGGAASFVAAIRGIQAMDREPNVRFAGILLASDHVRVSLHPESGLLSVYQSGTLFPGDRVLSGCAFRTEEDDLLVRKWIHILRSAVRVRVGIDPEPRIPLCNGCPCAGLSRFHDRVRARSLRDTTPLFAGRRA
jgi:hypothetical protein